MRRLSSPPPAAPNAVPPAFTLIAVGPARSMPLHVMIPSADRANACEPVHEARVQLFERVRDDGSRVDYCVVATPISGDGTLLHDYADQLTGNDADELLEHALSGALFASVDELEDLEDV